MAERPTLQTDRLILRPFALADAAAVQRLAGDPAIADTTLRIPHPYPDGVAEAWIGTHQESFDKGASVTFAITLRAGGELIGSIGLELRPAHRRAELGYWVGVPFWNRGYCTEAVRAVIAYGFAERGLNRIFAHHVSRNPASGRVMQKVGMRHEGHLRQHIRKGDRFEDIELYAILREDFDAQAKSPNR